MLGKQVVNGIFSDQAMDLLEPTSVVRYIKSSFKKAFVHFIETSNCCTFRTFCFEVFEDVV